MERKDRFTTTKWSVVLRARRRGDPRSREALASLCETYWYPLYVFVRRQGAGPDEALDLTQGYFLALLERDFLKDVRPELGKFRSFLLASLKHHLAHEIRRERAVKRGGAARIVSLDAEAAERRYRGDPQGEETPERAYERQWALAVVAQASTALRGELEADGKGDVYRLLAPSLTGAGEERPYGEVAAELGTSEASVKMAVRRLRQRFGRLLREEIAQTVDGPRNVDAELRHLLAVLREA